MTFTYPSSGAYSRSVVYWELLANMGAHNVNVGGQKTREALPPNTRRGPLARLRSEVTTVVVSTCVKFPGALETFGRPRAKCGPLLRK